MIPLGSKLKHRDKEEKLQNFSSLKLEGDAPGVRAGLAPGVTSSKRRNKEGKLQNSSFLKLEGAEV